MAFANAASGRQPSPSSHSTRSESPLTDLSSDEDSSSPRLATVRRRRRKNNRTSHAQGSKRRRADIDEFDRARWTDEEDAIPLPPGMEPRPKKEYLKAGLYSDAFKEDAATGKRGGRSSAYRVPVKAPSTDSVLPMPIHWGEELLTRQIDFLLPERYLPDSEAVRFRMDLNAKPAPYKEIKRNIWVNRPRLLGSIAVCMCEPGSGCGEGCMNRLMQYICDPKHCPCGTECTNQRLGCRPIPECEVVKCGKRGFGLKAKQSIKRGQLIDEYRGEIIDFAEATRRTVEVYQETGNFYLLDYDALAGEVIDGGTKGNRTRFANHSCDPNCHMQKWILCGNGQQLTAEFEVGLFASRDIEAGEELTYDYGWSMFVSKTMDGEITHQGTPIQCHCGAENCSGVLGGKKTPKAKEPAGPPKKKIKRKARKARSSVVASKLNEEDAARVGAQETEEASSEIDLLEELQSRDIQTVSHAAVKETRKAISQKRASAESKELSASAELNRPKPLRSLSNRKSSGRRGHMTREDGSSSRESSQPSSLLENDRERESSMTSFGSDAGIKPSSKLSAMAKAVPARGRPSHQPRISRAAAVRA